MKSIQWPDDLMNRKDSGDFLYKLVQQKYVANVGTEKKSSLTFALDGEWGAGKSFFIERWSKDIKNGEHLVIHFDAWKNDLSDEPLVGFLSEMKSSLKPLIAEIPKLSASSRKKLATQTKKFITQAGKALVPTALAIGKGFATRYVTKEGLEVISEVVAEEAEEKPIDQKEIAKASEKAIEKYFDDILKNHLNQKSAITQLVGELERLAQYLEETQKVNLPIYIFIDELDRCRPSYAIRLLEGLKHLFDAHGICFVISTNLSQLSESIKSVYGSGFDGYRYLKRFFDFEYKLPAPNNLALSEHLFKNSILSKRTKIKSGVCMLQEEGGMRDLTVPEIFSEIVTAFSLDIRSQKQVFSQAEGAIASISNDEIVYCVYIFYLAALAHVAPSAIDGVIANPRKSITNNAHFIDKTYLIHYHNSDGRSVKKQFSLSEFINFYHNCSYTPASELLKTQGEPLNLWFLEEMVQQSKTSALVVSKYPKLIRLAGNITNQ